MIPVSVVRFAPDGPCILQASSESWERMAPLLRKGARGDPVKESAALAVRSGRVGTLAAQRVTLSPDAARWILDTAEVG